MTDGQPSLDRIFDLLASRRRRYVLYHLDETDTDVVTLDEVAERVAAWERKWDGLDDRERDDHREHVRVALHHNHLPRLANAGLIDYDARSHTVRSWEEPSLEEWAKNDVGELPHLRELFTTSGA